MDKGNEKARGRATGDVCCDTAQCVLEAYLANDKLECATTNSSYTGAKNIFKDKYVMMQKFCSKRQNSTVCCGKKGGDDDCEYELKYKQWINYTIALDTLPYGGSCTYEIEAKCGYPNFVVNNTNIDMTIAFKKNQWKNDTYKPDYNDSYDDDETFNPKSKDGKIEFKLPKGDKHDDDDDDKDRKNETKCQKTKMYVTLTNLLNPNRP